MPLQSKSFRGDAKLEAAAVSNPGHIVPGARGEHVGKIQQALMLLDGATIEATELEQTLNGASTANAILAYKETRDIVNRTYQTRADNIVGIMTMATLDAEMSRCEQSLSVEKIRCDFSGRFRQR